MSSKTRRVYWFDYKFKKVLAPLHYPLSSQSSLLLFDLCYPIYCRVLKSENLFYANSLMWYSTVRYVVKVLFVKFCCGLFFTCVFIQVFWQHFSSSERKLFRNSKYKAHFLDNLRSEGLKINKETPFWKRIGVWAV